MRVNQLVRDLALQPTSDNVEVAPDSKNCVRENRYEFAMAKAPVGECSVILNILVFADIALFCYTDAFLPDRSNSVVIR